MADFEPCYRAAIRREGGYKLHTVEGDRGGMTYAGIARNFWSEWEGWAYIDQGEIPPTKFVRAFYRSNFWEKVKGDDIQNQSTASTLFDFAINAGNRTAIKLAQTAVGCEPDGVIGPRSLAALNEADGEAFAAAYALVKIKRYAEICNNDRSQTKFLLGWVNRAFNVLEEQQQVAGGAA